MKTTLPQYDDGNNREKESGPFVTYSHPIYVSKTFISCHR